MPAEELVPPPEDQESIIVRFSGNDPIPPKSFFQRIVTWFGFNGDPTKNGRKPPPQKQIGQKPNGYMYENPAKPFSPSPANLQQSPQTSTSYQPPGYLYEDPTKNLQNGFRYEPSPAKLQQQSQSGYIYNPPAKIQLQPVQQSGYTYDPPPEKLQLKPQSNGYTYDPPLNKLQEPSKQPPFSGYNYPPPPSKLQLQPLPTSYTYGAPPQPLKLQEAPKQTQFSGYNYDPPSQKLKRPISFNDLASSAASPTAAVYGLPPLPGFNQAQTAGDGFPCNKIPWLPIFPNAQELELLRKLQANNPNYFQPSNGYQNVQSIARPQAEKFQQQQQQLNAHTYLPPRQRPLRQPSINQIASINSLPLQSTATPFKSPPPTLSTEYLPAQKIVLPVETTQHNLTPVQVQSVSITPVPPLYDPRPFTANDAKGKLHVHSHKNRNDKFSFVFLSILVNSGNGFYINGHLVTPTGLSTTSVQSLQYVSQNHPVTQSQNIVQPSNSYGAPFIVTPATPIAATYGPPTNTYGTPPIKLTAEVTESSLFSRFKASQPFTARPSSLGSTPSPFDQTRLGTNNVVQNSNLIKKPIYISDNRADASESTRSPQGAQSNTISDEYQPILQVLEELNVTTTPQGFHFSATSTPPSLSIVSSSQYRKKEKKENKPNSNRETPLDLLDTPIQHFRKTSIGPSNTPNSFESNDGERVPDFKFMRNTWKPMAPSSFAHSQNPSIVTTVSPLINSVPVTPSAASAAFQSHTPHNANSITNSLRTKPKKVQVIIPYTSNSRPSPFKNTELQSFESSAGWSNSEHHDDHNSEESQVVSSATPSPNGHDASDKHNNHHHHHHNSPFLTKILAKNIRELLKREHLKNISTIDIEKLQKNIDGWTEQEFSMQLNRASTISLLAPAKHIPFEYLTTTQSLQDLLTTEYSQPTTDYPSTAYEMNDDGNTESDIGDSSQDEGEQFDVATESEDENEIVKEPFEIGAGSGENLEPDEQEAIQQAEEIEDDDFKRLDYLKALENNQVSGSEHQIFYATNPPPSQSPTPLPQPKTTTPLPPCSQTPSNDDNEAYVRTTVLPSADELWNKLKSLLAASDKGKEKVYIVTPQPYPTYFESEKIASNDENEVKFKSPRFLVRPTPGIATGRSASSNSFARLTFKPRGE